MTVRQPRFASVRDYGASLSDAAFWKPYVGAALARHGLPYHAPTAGAVGTYPTFLAGPHVVKLFGPRFSGGEGYAVERTLHTLFRERPEIPAPSLIADGTLFDGLPTDGALWSPDTPNAGAELEDAWPWPYLITTRLDGVPWRTASLGDDGRAAVAHQLGEAIRLVHGLPVPAGAYWTTDWIAARRPTCVARHRQWGSLPAHLIDQIDSYLREWNKATTNTPDGLVRRCVVHADLHADHLFVSSRTAAGSSATLTGIIDWGDAFACDPHYELPALHCGTFMGDKRPLRAFLEGYGWRAAPDFPLRAMAMTLLFEFDVLDDVRPLIERHAPRSLDDLAELLWSLD